MYQRLIRGSQMSARTGPCAVVTIALLAALAGACTGRAVSEEQSVKERLKTVRVQAVDRQDITEVLDYAADILPEAEVRIFSPVPDRIISFPWTDGDRILKGQRLAMIRKKGLDMGLENVGAQLDGLDIQIKNMASEMERSEKLKTAGVISDRAYDQLSSSLRASRAQRRALAASQGQLEVSAGNAVITAPISGVIADKMLQQGDMAAPGVPLCRIVVIDRLKVQLKLVESDVSKVRVGQKTLITLNAFPRRTFEGQVSKILPYLNAATRTNTVEIVLDNPRDPDDSEQYLLKPGMFGRAQLVVDSRAQAVTAPEPALLLDNRILEKQKAGEILRKAFVIDDKSTARERVVRLGARKGSIYEVLEGLKPGERIVVRGQHGLRDGQRVQVVEAEK